PANGLVVDGRYRLVTARTKALCALYGRQFQHRPGLAAPILLTPIPYAITLPATQLGHTIHFGHGRPRFVASRTTILPGRPCASLPSVGRRTKFLRFRTWRRDGLALHSPCRGRTQAPQPTDKTH